MSDDFKAGERVRALQHSELWGVYWHNGVVSAQTTDGRYVIRWDYSGTKKNWPNKAGPRPITSIVEPEDIQRR